MPPRTSTPAAKGPTPGATSAGRGEGIHYQVLARRYRSQSFQEVVGQETIATTLQNAIALGRTAHAYLFTGTRGVGKTSMARIFARALNLEGDASGSTGGGGFLLQAADVGEAILKGQDIDVIEIDGASNRGVDDARSLIAGAGIAPTRSPYKVYIIDEVHMLTTPAFNALLKTMEEPPAHVKFILCTTEAHKVPATIQSRCQRFDFRAIPVTRIQAHLAHVLATEGITWDAEALVQVARLANGSMRDGLSLLERLIAAAKGHISTELAHAVLGLPDGERLDAIVAAVAGGQPREALIASASLMSTGVSVDHLLELLAERFRLALVVASCGESNLPEDLSPEQCREAAAAASDMALEDLVQAVALCDATARTTRSSSIPRAILDALLVRLALSDRFASLSEGANSQPVQKKKVSESSTPAVTAPASTPTPLAAPRVAPPIIVNQQEAIAEAARDPLIQELMSALDATVVRVEVPEKVGVATQARPGSEEEGDE